MAEGREMHNYQAIEDETRLDRREVAANSRGVDVSFICYVRIRDVEIRVSLLYHLQRRGHCLIKWFASALTGLRAVQMRLDVF